MARVSDQKDSLDIDIVRSALDSDYVILEELGRGGMAMVYRAKERALDREVAIKVLPSFMIMDKAFVDRFQHEARTAGKLEHPNIVPIYRVGKKGRVIYFTMKLLRGQSLASVMRQRGKVGVPEIRRILLETASALGYAAKRGVVHRDIKPDNILLDDEGRCVLTDFGIAKSAGGPLTAAGTSMGTPSYMSPEHARGHPLDGRSDIYSLGVVAYECLSGSIPFKADDPFAILYKHINEALPRPELETDEERALYVIIEKMLAKEPKARYQTADELIAALGGTPAPTTTLVSMLASGIGGTGPQRVSGMSATEIIPTPKWGMRLKELSRDNRVLAALVTLVLVSVGLVVLPRNQAATTGAAPVVGATTRAGAGATTGATVGASTRADTSRVAGATTGATTGARVAGAPDTARGGATKQLTPVGATPVASRPAPVVRAPFSKCPASPDSAFVLMDTVLDTKRRGKLTVRYDVCGLKPRTPYNTFIRFRRVEAGFLGRRPDDQIVEFPDFAPTPRHRVTKPIDLASLRLEDAQYYIDVLVRRPGTPDIARTRTIRVLR
jgi:hypothetical protein